MCGIWHYTKHMCKTSSWGLGAQLYTCLKYVNILTYFYSKARYNRKLKYSHILMDAWIQAMKADW